MQERLKKKQRNAQNRIEQRFESFAQAMKIYIDSHQTSYVPRGYVVPTDSVYPRELWGFRLGVIYDGVMTQSNYMNEYYLDRMLSIGIIDLYYVSYTKFIDKILYS